MQPLETPTTSPSTTTHLEHVACCLAPVGEPDTMLCGQVEMVEPDDGIDPWEPTCVVCIDLERTSYCPHGTCLFAACTRGHR